jgi:hypothetical protein
MYPVSERVCARCGAKSLVTKSITFEPLPKEEHYYQCMGGVEADCAEFEQEMIEREEMEDRELRSFMEELNHTVNNMSVTEWR